MRHTNIYYIIWSDTILSYKKHHQDRIDWKLLLFLMSSVNGINLWIVLVWLKYLKILSIPALEFDFFSGYTLDSSLSFAIQFVLPFIIINYSLVFYKKRYLKIVEKYPNPKKKYSFIYMMAVIWIALFSAILYGFLTGTIFPK